MSSTEALNADRGTPSTCATHASAYDCDDDTVLGCEAALPYLTAIFDGPVTDASATTAWAS